MTATDTRIANTEFDPTHWVRHFLENRARHEELRTSVDWSTPASAPEAVRLAVGRSLQRFELGEGGDGEHLLGKARAAATEAHVEALGLFVREEQRHSELFARGLEHLGVPTLEAHWSDAAFTSLRRFLGLRTELSLFLVVESIAMEYFVALAEHGPTEVVRAIGVRIAGDEIHHIEFQVQQLRMLIGRRSALIRGAIFAAWWLVAVGTATVMVVDHAASLRACACLPIAYWGRALRRFRRAARRALFAE